MFCGDEAFSVGPLFSNLECDITFEFTRGWDGARTLLRCLSDFLDVFVAAQRFGENWAAFGVG